jgi:phytoene dehydrogenase-like protein
MEVVEMQDRNGRVDVVVIGAGLAGLAAATVAAREGASVTVVDARPPGGRGRSIVRDGYVLNEGAHALYKEGAGAAVLRQLGVRFHGGTPDLSNAFTWWDGELRPIPLTTTAMLTTKLLGARSKLAAGRLFSALTRGADDTAGLIFGEWLDHRRVPADLRKYVEVIARLSTYCAEPSGMAATAVVAQLGVASGGVWYVDGGWQTIVDGLVRAATGSGVDMIADSEVTAVERDGGNWVVRSGERDVVCTTVVIAAGGPAVATRLVGRDPGWQEQAGPPVRAACLDVGVDAAPAVSYIYSADDPLYLSKHAPTARLAPAGHELYGILRYLRTSETLTPAVARADVEMHAARAGLVADGRTLERFMASMVVAWGLPLADRQRPRGDELAADGIVVAGDWVGDHLLGDAALASGAAAGRSAGIRRAVAV